MTDRHAVLQSLVEGVRGGRLTRREFFSACARLGIGLVAASSVLRTLGGGTASAAALQGPLNILVWDDHFDEPELKDFLATTGVKINTSLFDENADAYAKTKLVGGRQIDVVSGDALWGPRYHQSGLVDPLDLSQFASAKELFPVFREISFWKVGNRSIMFPWSWAPIIPYYDPRYVTPFDSYEALFDPKYRRRIVMASSWSWVTYTNVIFTSRWIRASSIRICLRSLRSSAPSGSSSSRTAGSLTSARARAIRCCCPPLN